MDDVISSVQFFPIAGDPAFPDCRVYYNAPISVDWDFNLDNVFETRGQNPAFSAAELDGPSVQTVLARGQHPTDTGPLGQGSPITVGIKVRNVAPTITHLSVVDSLGRVVGRDVPFALANLEYSVQGSFTDPGKPDHQTATLNLGDGTTVPNSAFDLFSDAFGGATGQLRKRHLYDTPGTYTIALEVLDDDGGAGVASAVVRVVTPEQAVEEIIRMLDDVIASATNDGVRQDLEQARKALAGSNDDSNNGALEKIRDGNEQAAMTFLRQAIDRLRRAEAGGADVATHIALLEQVVAALSAG